LAAAFNMNVSGAVCIFKKDILESDTSLKDFLMVLQEYNYFNGYF
jgi:ABC-type thiamine transport system ATPase subunit